MTNTVMAYILMKVDIGKTDQVVNELRMIEEATKIAVTTGEYDIIVRLEVPDLEALYTTTVRRIHSIPGIKETSTAVIEKMLSS